MTALIVLGAVAAFFALLLLLPVGADVAFDEGGPQVALLLGPVRLQVLPAKPKKAGGKKAERGASKQKKARKKPAVAAAHRAGGRIEDFWPFVRLGLSFLGALRRRLLVKRLELTITFDGEDPAKTAIRYGQAQAVAHALLPQLGQVFRIRRQSVALEYGFTGGSLRITCILQVRLLVLDALALALRYGLRAYRIYRSQTAPESAAADGGEAEA
ncbi:MAG: hypothetical protein V8S89_01105 [Oscillospiraceae bacterium]